ncbi:MAG: hypothetical protein NT105_19985 [Verrucomicrobia bacterium]|nr:hypothetical protein [Verrucomicrobiota bacterium]
MDDFSSSRPAGWQLSGVGAKGLSVISNALDGASALCGTLRVAVDSSPHAAFLTKKFDNLPGLQQWERLTFSFRLGSTNNLVPERALMFRFRTGPAEFTDLPFARLRDVKPGQWQAAVVRLDSFAEPRNIYSAYFHPLKELTFRIGVAEGQAFEGDFAVANIRLYPKSPPDWQYKPRVSPRKSGNLSRALLITHSAASFYFVRETLEALGTTVDRRLFRGLHFPIFDFPASSREMMGYDLVALVDVDPYVLTRAQVEMLCDYVASGGGLLFMGGPTTLSAAKSFPRPLAEMLPAANAKDRSIFSQRSCQLGRVALLNDHPNVAATTDGCYFASGEYRTRLARTCQWLAGQEPDAVNLPGYTAAPADFPQAPPLERSNFFPIISMLGTEGGGHLLDERALRERVDDLCGHGFNTVAIGGLRHLARKPWDNRTRLLDYAIRYAQSRGMAVMFEYEHLTNIGPDTPPKPCVFAPDYREKLAETLKPKFSAARQYSRVWGIKILDEPTASEKSLDYCELCQREFQKRFGRPLRKRADIPASDNEGHLQLSQFISDYVAAGYDAIRQVARESAAPFGLLLTYMSPGYGYADNRRGLEDVLGWSRAADYVDFDVYPYFYPVSQNIRMLQAHFCFAVQRAIAGHLGKPAGFYVELDDRNYPFQINPVEASSECAWTAISQGCHYLNSFINNAFGTGTGARPERWDHLGRELRKIREAGPTLLHTRKAPSPLALYFPHAQWMSGGRKFAPAYAYQLLLRAFGECDIAHEQIVAGRDGFEPVKVLAMVETDYLPKKAVARLAGFLRAGGWIVCDDTVKLPDELRDNPRLIRFSGSLEQRFHDAIETPDARTRADLLRQVRAALAKTGVTSHARANNEDVETSVLMGDKIELLVAVNHAAKPVTASVQLASRPQPLRISLPARSGALIPVESRRHSQTTTP